MENVNIYASFQGLEVLLQVLSGELGQVWPCPRVQKMEVHLPRAQGEVTALGQAEYPTKPGCVQTTGS